MLGVWTSDGECEPNCKESQAASSLPDFDRDLTTTPTVWTWDHATGHLQGSVDCLNGNKYKCLCNYHIF